MSEAINDGGPAFPVSGFEGKPDSAMKNWILEPQNPSEGMTLRDWFAGQALPGLVASVITLNDEPDRDKRLAYLCYLVADAMLAEREKARKQ